MVILNSKIWKMIYYTFILLIASFIIDEPELSTASSFYPYALFCAFSFQQDPFEFQKEHISSKLKCFTKIQKKFGENQKQIKREKK